MQVTTGFRLEKKEEPWGPVARAYRQAVGDHAGPYAKLNGEEGICSCYN